MSADLIDGVFRDEDGDLRIHAINQLDIPGGQNGLLSLRLSRQLVGEIARRSSLVDQLYHLRRTLRTPSSVFSGLRDVWPEAGPADGGLCYAGYDGPPGFQPAPPPRCAKIPDGFLFTVMVNPELWIVRFSLEEVDSENENCPRGFSQRFDGARWIKGGDGR